ncbi:PREDICTED: probable calcium-binding protein CML30 [Nicotiana attenuata]|uniref:Calcium-binding protein cml30 n=1 Tax=Nicotiana attenuata TaxID=49451 RepID=A0A314KT88_NICAT|nr:PREDICTED: probable calcium-binding protein CML30 [Nicotiana attenuata]OIT32548.1 putative calcium-binding protein cml30 [Nicotiana attenuata]
MEKIVFSFSAQGKKIADGLNHFNSTILSCIILGLVITFQEFRSCFFSLFRAILLVFTPYNKSETSSKSKNCGPEIVTTNNEALLQEDFEIIFDTLMTFCNSNGDDFDKVGLAEVFDSFDETEPSLEEVKEAFDMFHENGDGYIDANELKKVICKMGFLEFSLEDCQRMIVPYDENTDGKIEFAEFLKLMEQSTMRSQVRVMKTVSCRNAG